MRVFPQCMAMTQAAVPKPTITFFKSAQSHRCDRAPSGTSNIASDGLKPIQSAPILAIVHNQTKHPVLPLKFAGIWPVMTHIRKIIRARIVHMANAGSFLRTSCSEPSPWKGDQPCCVGVVPSRTTRWSARSLPWCAALAKPSPKAFSLQHRTRAPCTPSLYVNMIMFLCLRASLKISSAIATPKSSGSKMAVSPRRSSA